MNTVQNQPSTPEPKAPAPRVVCSDFYLDSAYAQLSEAIAFRWAWKNATRHKAARAHRAQMRAWMREAALRAVRFARFVARHRAPQTTIAA